MRDLESRLRDLGSRWEAPDTPDLIDGVMAGHPAPRHLRSHPRRIVVTLAVTAALLGMLAAIAPARDAILDFFDIGGVRIESGRTPSTPPPPRQTTSPVATIVDLATARSQAPFLRAPTLFPAPGRVEVARPYGELVYEMSWTAAQTSGLSPGRLRLTQLRGALVLGKTVDPARTTVRDVEVNGRPGVWLSGGPHAIGYLDRSGELRVDTLRTAGDVLVWEEDGVTVRVEGTSDLAAALRVAASLR